MANEKVLIGILTIVLVFGMVVVSCDNTTNGSGNGNTELNGTWVGTVFSYGWWASAESSGTVDIESVFTFDDETFEYFEDKHSDSIPHELIAKKISVDKGTYTTNGGKIKFTKTHIFGDSYGLDSKWYSKSEIKATGQCSDEDIEDMFYSVGYFLPVNDFIDHSINNNTLVFTIVNIDDKTGETFDDYFSFVKE